MIVTIIGFINVSDAFDPCALCRLFVSKKANKTQQATKFIQICGRGQKNSIYHADSSNTSFQRIDGCEMIKKISNGAFGKVYLIRMNDFYQNQHAALKVFNSVDASFNEFECKREKEMLRYISVHEQLMGQQLQIAHIREDIHGVCCPNLMLEYIDGFDLNDKSLGTYSFDELLDLVQDMMHQIGDGVLTQLHSLKIYHNDLKPANIIFSPRKQLFYLIDFGLAMPLELLHHSEFERANFFTTLPFMSPWHFELVRRSRYCPANSSNCKHHYERFKYNMMDNNETRLLASKADFYSFGITVMQILGRHCHSNDSLCSMSRRVLSFQTKWFDEEEQQTFINWDLQGIRIRLRAYWKGIRWSISNYMQWNPNQHTTFMSTISDWLRL